MIHPKNRADRRAINAKKKRKVMETRTIEVSFPNILAFVETGLHSMKLINHNEQIHDIVQNEIEDTFTVYLKKEVSENN